MPRVARSFGVRPGEGHLVGLVAAIFATIELARGFGEIAVDTLVIGRFGEASLPWLFIGLGIASLAVTLAYGAALGRLRRARLFVGVLLLSAAVIGAQQLALVAGAPVVPLLWLTVYAAGAVAVTLAWTLAGAVLDARQAKRLFPLVTSAAIAGSFAGTLAAGPVAALVGTEWVVGLEALLLAAAAILVGRLAADPAGGRLRLPPPRRPIVAEVRAGFDFVARSPLMRLVAVAYILFSVLMFSVTSRFFGAMSEAFPADASADLATALGLLSAAVTGTSFVVALVIAPRVYARFGVASAAVVLPIVYLAGFGLWLVAFTPMTAAIVRYAQQVTQRGLSNAAWSAFYNTVPAERRAQVLAFMDGVPGQLGIVLSGVLLLLTGTLLGPNQIVWVGAIAALACTGVVLAIRRRYADSLVRALRAGLGEQVLEGGPGLRALAADAQATETLVAGLAAPEPAVRRTAVELLGRLRAVEASAAITALIADPDPGVRAAALDTVASLDAGTATIALERLLIDDEPVVRAAAVRAAARLDPEAIEPLAERLAADPSAEVRAGLAVALAGTGEDGRAEGLIGALLWADDGLSRAAGLWAVGQLDGRLRSPDRMHERVVAALDDPDRSVRRAAADVLRAAAVPSPAVLALLGEGSPRAQEAALWALDGHAILARKPVLAWAAGQVGRARQLQTHQAALGRAGMELPDGSLAFLGDLLARRQSETHARLLQALAVLGAPEAAGLIRRCLASGDPDTRAQAIEALDSIGDGELRRAVVGLLDDRPLDDAAIDLDRVLRDLVEDPDRWIRALTLRVQAVRLAEAWTAIRERGAADPDPVVREAASVYAADGGPRMPDTARTLTDIDRMLFLRRVPLFAALGPEDLQRLAMTATERLYPPGEALVREGEVGNELIVIVDGSVRVVRIDADGAERLLREYAAGDHIGELALLREAPRAATVLADPPGVRGLVIGGEGLTAILRERPEAAMAMLATLAERISRQ